MSDDSPSNQQGTLERLCDRVKRYAKSDSVVAACILLLCSMTCWGRFLFSGNIPLLRDLFYHHIPRKIFYAKVLNAGALPLWTSNTGCGQPFLAEIESATLYPLSLIYLALPLPAALNISLIFHCFLTAFGVYLFMRFLKVSHVSSLLAAISLAFSTTWVVRVEFYPSFTSCAWYPLILATFVYWLEQRKRWVAILLALQLAIQFLAGWPEASIFSAASLILLSLISGVDEWIAHRRAKRAFAPLMVVFLCGALAILMSMAQIIPTWEALTLSERASGVKQAAEYSSVSPLNVFCLLYPSAYGVPGYGANYWGPSTFEYWQTAFYVGIAPVVVLISVAIFWVSGQLRTTENELRTSIQRIRFPFLVSLFLLSFAYALGHYTPFFSFMHSVFPLLSWIRTPCKLLIVSSFALCSLTGLGLDQLMNSLQRPVTFQPYWKIGIARWSIIAMAVVLGCFTLISSLTPVSIQLERAAEWMPSWKHHVRILESYFNLDTRLAVMSDRFPWDSLAYDAIKLPIAMGIASAFILLAMTNMRFQKLYAYGLSALTFCDLLVMSISLVPSGPSDTLKMRERARQAYELGGREARFYQYAYFAQQQFYYGARDPRVFQQARDSLASAWPLAEEAFNVQPNANFNNARLMNFLAIERRQIDFYDLGTQPEIDSRKLAMLGCNRIISRSHPARWWFNATSDPLKFALVENVLPRAFVVGSVTRVGPSEEILSAMQAILDDPLNVAITDETTLNSEDLKGLVPGHVDFELKSISYRPNEIEIEVEAGREGVLVVTETQYPGWQGTVNGIVTPIWRVNVAFQGIRVPAGRSVVQLSYRPQLFRIGCYISFASLLLWLLLAARAVWDIPKSGRRSNRDLD